MSFYFYYFLFSNKLCFITGCSGLNYCPVFVNGCIIFKCIPCSVIKSFISNLSGFSAVAK